MITEKDMLEYCASNDAFVNQPEKGPMYITADGRFVWVRRIGDMHRELFYFYDQDNNIDSDWDDDLTDFEYDYNWVRLNDGRTPAEEETYFVCFSRPNDLQKEKLLDWLYYLISVNKMRVQFVDSKSSKHAFFDLNTRTPEELWNSLKQYWTSGILLETKLYEDTRTMLVAKSRNAGAYKNKSHGKNRFERKKYSKIANAVRQYNKIDMNDLFKQDVLQVTIPVTGETDNYEVTVKMEGVIAEIARNIKNNHNRLEYRTVIQSLTKVFNTTNVYVKCTCDDFKYRFAHWNIVNNVSADDTAHDPGPGKGIANPHDDKGRGCKHILLVLANGDWMMKVASVINNYIHYAEEHLQKPFLKLIFPKLYGIPAEEMVEQNLVDDDKFLDSSTGLIDAINEYGKNRGKIKPGTNKKPVAQKEKDKQQQKPNEQTDEKSDKEAK